jgi:hypothetical protein
MSRKSKSSYEREQYRLQEFLFRKSVEHLDESSLQSDLDDILWELEPDMNIVFEVLEEIFGLSPEEVTDILS